MLQQWQSVCAKLEYKNRPGEAEEKPQTISCCELRFFTGLWVSVMETNYQKINKYDG